MARPKKDLYQGGSLFDFIEQDIKHNFKTLDQGEVNEQGNNTRGNEVTRPQNIFTLPVEYWEKTKWQTNKEKVLFMMEMMDSCELKTLEQIDTRMRMEDNLYSLMNKEKWEERENMMKQRLLEEKRKEEGYPIPAQENYTYPDDKDMERLERLLPQQDYIAILTMRCENTWRADLYDNYGMKILIRWMYY